MKKHICILALCLLATVAIAQQVTITKTDSTTVTGRVGARSATAIYVNNKMVGHKEIARVTIEETGPQAGTLIEYLNKYNIAAIQKGGEAVSFSKKEVAPLQGLDLRLDNFARQRDTGKALQVIGVLASALGFLIQTDNEDIGKALQIGGGISSIVGLGIDIDASKHLKSKR